MWSNITVQLWIQIQSQHITQSPKPGAWLFSSQWSNKSLWFRHWSDWNQIIFRLCNLMPPVINSTQIVLLEKVAFLLLFFLNFPAFYTSWFCPCQKHNCQNIMPDLESLSAKLHPQDDYVIYWSSLNYPYFKLLKQPYSWLWFLLISFYQSILKTAQKWNYMQKFYLLYGHIFFYGVWDISCSSGLVCNREM